MLLACKIRRHISQAITLLKKTIIPLHNHLPFRNLSIQFNINQSQITNTNILKPPTHTQVQLNTNSIMILILGLGLIKIGEKQ